MKMGISQTIRAGEHSKQTGVQTGATKSVTSLWILADIGKGNRRELLGERNTDMMDTVFSLIEALVQKRIPPLHFSPGQNDEVTIHSIVYVAFEEKIEALLTLAHVVAPPLPGIY